MTFFAASTFYAFTVWMWPKAIYPPGYDGVVPTTWEYMAKTDGYFSEEVAERGGESSDSVERVGEVFEEKGI